MRSLSYRQKVRVSDAPQTKRHPVGGGSGRMRWGCGERVQARSGTERGSQTMQVAMRREELTYADDGVLDHIWRCAVRIDDRIRAACSEKHPGTGRVPNPHTFVGGVGASSGLLGGGSGGFLGRHLESGVRGV